ncbi:MAG TPA: hypothetical protein PKY78_01470 [Candidatus Omnitrophota bacterium]|nr:hypothetical protein [Candidatus Omnitrophota bacterium]HPS19650.1 hypothetical protein [Candidatus Omnitrophota bacterium]
MDKSEEKNGRYSTDFELYADLTAHVVITVLLAWFFYIHTDGSFLAVALTFLGGILLDTDHFIDHFAHFGFKLDRETFMYHKYLDSGKCYIVFHSWELAIGICSLSYYIPVLLPFGAGMFAHLLWDQLFSHIDEPLFYCLSYRMYNGFELEKISKKLYRKYKKD